MNPNNDVLANGPETGSSHGQGLEREKWEAEQLWRDREITIKEREADIKQREAARALWQTPIGAAIIAATIAAVANAGVAAINGIYQRDLEDRKSESALILDAIKTGNDQKKAQDNLEFLVNTHLISDEKRRAHLTNFLSTIKQENFPALPTNPNSWISTSNNTFYTLNCSGRPHLDLASLRDTILREDSSLKDISRSAIVEDELAIIALTPGGEHGFTTIL